MSLISFVGFCVIIGICRGVFVITDEKVRIISDDSDCNEGRIEIKTSFGWGMFSDCNRDGFGDSNGNLICNQLGFDGMKGYSVGNDGRNVSVVTGVFV